MKTPAEKTITFTFGSHPMKEATQRWRAKLTFPAGATAETVLPISLTDGTDTPISRATFEFAGCRIPIVEGKGSIVYADFIKGKHETALWVYRGGLPPVPGGLTFE